MLNRETNTFYNYRGLSGPAIKPVACEWYGRLPKRKIPVIGLGGICSAKDAIEFLIAGATAIQVR